MEGLPACNRLDFSILRGEGRKGVGGVSRTRGVGEEDEVGVGWGGYRIQRRVHAS